MSWGALLKVVVCTSALGGSLWGLNHAEVRRLGRGFLGMIKGWKGAAEYKQSTCLACLDAGKDFCISSNSCIPRATFKCRGPEDHITGDKEFALHGNPHTQHSMTCPAEKNYEKDTKDCYFDKECHGKVDWEKIGEVKKGFFARLQFFKEHPEKYSKQNVQMMMKKVHALFLKAGMPDDRIDYIIQKWVKGVLPQALDDSEEDSQASCQACLDAGKDFCISSSKCIPRATFKCLGPEDHITGDKEFALHGNPEGIKHSMKCPAAKKDGVDTKDCYFDKECHDKVDWEKVGNVKKGFFARLEFLKENPEKYNNVVIKMMMKRVHVAFEQAGMPEDRIDYIIEKWVKGILPKALDGGDEDTQKDCYFDKECHAKVDWDKIAEVKKDFFARLKEYSAKDDAAAVKQMLAPAHKAFQEAGMPDDRIDYILNKWVNSVFMKPKVDMCTMGKKRCVQDGQKIFEGKCAWIWKKCDMDNGSTPMAKPKVFKMPMCAMAKERCIQDGKKLLTGRCAWIWKRCDMSNGVGPMAKPMIFNKPDMCTMAKQKCTKDGEKVVEGRCAWVWKRCDMESRNGPKVRPTVFNRPKVDMCAAAKENCIKDGEKVLTGKCAWVWKKCESDDGVLV